MVTLSFTIFSGQKNYNRAHMLFQVLCGFEPIFYTTHPNEESEKENKSFWHIELETLPYRNRESKGKYCITTFLHGMYYPDEDIFTHIDYTKNQYDIDTYLNKYSDCNEDMPIDTYTSSNELHYKIWCIEGGKYSRETWYRLMVVSLNQEYVELLDEILE